MWTQLFLIPTSDHGKNYKAMVSCCNSTQILVSEHPVPLRETRASWRKYWLQVFKKYKMISDISQLKMSDTFKAFKVFKIKRHFHHHPSLAIYSYISYSSSFSASFKCTGFRFTMQQCGLLPPRSQEIR